MKRIGLLLAALILGTTAIMAQPGGQRNFDPEEMAKRQTAQLKEALDLNQDQEKKVYDLNLETGKEMRALREKNQGGGWEAMREDMTKIREGQDKKMKAILTDDQWVKYQKYQQERRERRRQGGGSGGM